MVPLKHFFGKLTLPESLSSLSADACTKLDRARIRARNGLNKEGRIQTPSSNRLLALYVGLFSHTGTRQTENMAWFLELSGKR